MPEIKNDLRLKEIGNWDKPLTLICADCNVEVFGQTCGNCTILECPKCHKSSFDCFPENF